MKKFSRNFLSLMAVVILQSSFVWAKQNDIAIFNQKIKSEALVTGKLTAALAKNLDPKFFQIQVKTEIAPVSLEVQRVDVTLQLSQQLTPTYHSQLAKWITQWVEQTYGVRGQAKVEWMPVEVIQSVSAFWYDLVLLGGLLAAAIGLLVRAILKARPPVQLCFAFIEGKVNNSFAVELPVAEEIFIASVDQLELVPQIEVKKVEIVEMNEMVKEAEPEISAIEALAIEPLVLVEPFVETQEEPKAVSPFEFIEQLDNEKIKDLFFSFDLSQQAAFFMKAPRATVQRLTSILDKQLVVQILAESAFMPEASDEDLIAKMQLWQTEQQNKPVEPVVPVVNEKFLRLKEIWLELPRKERALLLDKLSKENPDLENLFLQGQDEVNVLKNWAPEKLRKFCLQARSRELGAAITVLPFLAETILAMCPQAMKKEVLFEAQSMDAAKTEKNFDSFIMSFDRFVAKATTARVETQLVQIKTKLKLLQ